MRPPFLRVFPAERKRVGWVDSACNYAHKRFVLLRLRSRYFFKLQYFRASIFVRDRRLHHRFLTGPERGIRTKGGKKNQNSDQAKRGSHDLETWRAIAPEANI
jgi:hypothetical protein